MPTTLRKIKLSVAGAGSYGVTLADETASPMDVISDDFRPVKTSLAQVRTRYGQASKRVRDAGNAQVDVSFTVKQVHDDAEAAAQFIADRGAELDGLFDLQYTQGAVVLYLANCKCTRFEPVEQTGVSTAVRYTFVGETYSDVDPS